MRINFLYLFLLVPLFAEAGVPKIVEFENFEKEGIRFKQWHDLSKEDISFYKENAHCYSITFFVPSTDSMHPEFKRIESRVELRKEGKLFSFLDVDVFALADQKKTELSTCIPYNLGFEAHISYSYNPENTDMIPLCPPSFKIKNIEKLLGKIP